MAIQLQATYRSFSPPIKAESRIQQRLKSLERLHQGIQSCALIAEKFHDHQLRGTVYRVAIAAMLSGGETIADHDHHNQHSHEDLFVALDDAFDALERVLKTHSKDPAPVC
jgi:ribosome-associated translation inhibitor RaiA